MSSVPRNQIKKAHRWVVFISLEFLKKWGYLEGRQNQSMKEKIKKILKIISYIFGGFLILIAISNLNILWGLFFGVPGILLISLPELADEWMKERHKKKTIELETKTRMLELGLNPNKDWQEYYKIRNEEEKKLKNY